MTTERAQELQTAITKEALALMVIHGDYVCTAAEADDIHVSHFEKVIKLIGEAWGLPERVTTANLSMLDQEREVVRKLGAGEDVEHIMPENELPMNATGMETLDNVWGLFETAVAVDDREQRTALLNLAQELAECQNLLDWIEKSPAEKDLPEIAVS